MKIFIHPFILFFIVSSLSCSKNSDLIREESCYIFITRTEVTSSSPLIGVPLPVSDTTEQCGLTATEAESVKNSLTKHTTTTYGQGTPFIYTITETQDCTYFKKK